jgi:hypothetical protein
MLNKLSNFSNGLKNLEFEVNQVMTHYCYHNIVSLQTQNQWLWAVEQKNDV